MVELICDNPLHPAYFYPIIIMYVIIFGLIYVIMYYVRKYYEKSRRRAISTSIIDGIDYEDEFLKGKDKLKFRYLVAYMLTRSAIWAKAPYLYVIYNKYHGFNVNEIGVLYVIDAMVG